MAEDILGLTLSVDGDRAVRKFSSYRDTRFFGAIKQIKGDKYFPGQLASAFRGIYGKEVEQSLLEKAIKDILRQIDKMLGHEEDMTWHLRELAYTLYQERGYSKYRIIYKTCKDHLFFALFGAKDDQKQAGEEHENWKLIARPFFLVVPPPKSIQNRDKARGLADTIFFLAPQLLENKDDSEALLNVLSWFKIELECTIVSLNKRHKKIFQLDIKPSVDASCWPTVEQKCISVAPDKLVLLVSPNVARAIEKLYEVWRNPTAKTVLLTAATGSGKEVLMDLLADAMGIEEERRMDFALPVIESITRLGYQIAQKLRKHPSKRILVFLDEVHHPGLGKTRCGLLRLMEADRLRTEQGESSESKSVLFVLAASKPFDELRGLDPPDLWNRIEYLVDLKHPLLVSHKKTNGTMRDREEILGEREDILKEYFNFFWYRQVETWKKSTPLPHIHRVLQALEENNKLVDALSEELVEELKVRFSPLISIRTIRSITKRLLGEAEHNLRLGKGIDPSCKEIIRGWIDKACTALIPEIGPGELF